MKIFRIGAAVAFVSAALLSMRGATNASAQGGVNLDDPAQASSIDGAPHKIAGKSALWFRFDYSPLDDNGNHINKTITLLNGKESGVRFEVWTPDHVNDWWDGQKPVGRGTVDNVNCDTSEQSDMGPCQSSDLTWVGGFNRGAAYFVRVFNDNNDPVIFTLTIN